MSLALPLSSSPLRQLFDVAHLAEMAAPENRFRLATLKDAKASARRTFEAAGRAARGVHAIYLAADGSLVLAYFGPRGGFRKLWNFGTL